MKIVKRFVSVLLVFIMLLALFACSSEKDPQTDENATEQEFETIELETEEATVETTTEEEVVVPTLPQNMNPLTGLECSSSLVGQRPIGVMFNNIKDALPQVGLSNCDIIYEVLAEGGITRFEGLIFDYASLGSLGSIRSSRPYYVNIARAYDAVYIHAGGSDPAYSLMSKIKYDHFDGVRGNFYVNGQLLFWRDKTRLNSGYSTEHTMFVRGTDIAQAIQDRKIRANLKDSGFTAFAFDPAFVSIGSGKTANYVKIPHSNYYVSEFNYDSATGLYAHTHYKTAHIDGANGEQIKATNVFLLYTKQRVVDSVGRREITLTGEGEGYYFNGGEYTEIVWKRENDDAPFKYFNTDGTELKVKQGKSYVCLVDVNTKNSVTIS